MVSSRTYLLLLHWTSSFSSDDTTGAPPPPLRAPSAPLPADRATVMEQLPLLLASPLPRTSLLPCVCPLSGLLSSRRPSSAAATSSALSALSLHRAPRPLLIKLQGSCMVTGLLVIPRPLRPLPLSPPPASLAKSTQRFSASVSSRED
ncbi:hypothetical protein Syun_018832 [Stephania yunnanensis]|uniref:Uncharacterized protein n=1 Tax=Stephania yunnanensis TaxID=152371 RepID=A0AAP0IU32_9MAGN